MADYILIAAKKIPNSIRKIILDEKFIDIAVNIPEENTPMEYLFDAYEEFVDISGEFDDFQCYTCRQHVLTQWKLMKPHLIEMQNATEQQ